LGVGGGGGGGSARAREIVCLYAYVARIYACPEENHACICGYMYV